ncbi:NAD(P)/FAD-dependent oxidoreductase [Geosporobacter ferrireducens]|uniref:FAD-binding domain-containing protein n=1 Tax=Geosporobacter ferrireducens TaxID=1424294 RepID=A0A1D8GHT0_9FIRM|nr:geranylgeranyl reductase family protein [Geosporobacter ferrireducens]AOT70483.1 hypothetical protein Gferi_13390 [Geosporobacter ferrireducens]MTI57169.1 geranylgeranyl reductase family protein [Geosporobacter ferrireducens]
MTANQESYDVIVVGAGPAGATAARKLAMSGCRVLLIDQADFPRDKHCGGLIPVKALKLLDFEIPKRTILNEIHSITLYSQHMGASTYKDPGILGKTVNRRDFDHQLLNQAIAQGVRFYQKTRLQHLVEEKQHIRVITSAGEYVCSTLLGCDGTHSTVKRFVEKKHSFEHYKMGFAVNTLLPVDHKEPFQDFKLFGLPLAFAMGWAIPQGNRINIGIGGPAYQKKQMMDYFQVYLRKVMELYLHIDKPKGIRGSFLPAGGFQRKVQKGNILLAGDAAGFVDPFTGEGIYYALQSGELAAEKIMAGKITDYEAACKHFFGRRLQGALISSLLCYKKRYTEVTFLRELQCKKFVNRIKNN